MGGLSCCHCPKSILRAWAQWKVGLGCWHLLKCVLRTWGMWKGRFDV